MIPQAKQELEFRILVVENNKHSQNIIKVRLKKIGYENIKIVREGNEALFYCIKHYGNINLIFLDYELDGSWNGLVTAEKILKAYPNIPIISWSSHNDELEYKKKCIGKGVQGFLGKKCDPK